MLNAPDFRKNLLVSIVTSVLVLIFIEPLLKLAANGLMWLGANISASFTRSVYTSAALGFREKFSFMHLLLFTSLVVGGMIGVEISNFRRQIAPKTTVPRGQSKFKKAIGPLFFLLFFYRSRTHPQSILLNFNSMHHSISGWLYWLPRFLIRELSSCELHGP